MSIAHRALLVAALGLVLAACGAIGEPTPSPGQTGQPTPAPTSPPAIDHPTGETDVVLRLEQGGGLVPFGFFITQTPLFTLYGDGTIIYRNPRLDPPPAEGSIIRNNPLRIARLSAEQMQSLLAFALADGGLGVARARYDYGIIADAPWSTFTIRAGGLDKKVDVYALGIEGPDVPDAAIRAAMGRLAEQLRGMDALSSVEARSYEPQRYRGVLLEDPGIPAGGPRVWPWTDIQPSDFVIRNDPDGPSAPIRVMTPEEVAATGLDRLEGGASAIFLRGPGDAKVYSLAVRPLLPDESR
jgi:hypothetical protein